MKDQDRKLYVNVTDAEGTLLSRIEVDVVVIARAVKALKGKQGSIRAAAAVMAVCADVESKVRDEVAAAIVRAQGA